MTNYRKYSIIELPHNITFFLYLLFSFTESFLYL
nr:MAG TPA: hypothetical protein [Caudoviricetes sp.]